MAEILARSRKVRTQIPIKAKMVVGCMVADRKVWPDAGTGAKGQRPTHGRAGAGLASTAGIVAGSHDGSGATIRKFVLTLALTFYPLPPGEEIAFEYFWLCG